MKQDEIIEMAREIAAQYSKAERFQTWTHDFIMQRLMYLVNVSAAKEREACAKACDEVGEHPSLTPQHCAESIRARGEQA